MKHAKVQRPCFHPATCGAAAVLLLFTAVAPAEEWRAVPADSRLSYTAFFESAPITGRFGSFEVIVQAEDDVPRKIRVVVDIDSVTMGGRDIMEGIRSEEWFDVANHARSNYDSARIAAIEPGRFRSLGTLRLKGVEEQVQVPFTWRRLDRDRVAMKGSVELQREDFHIGGEDWSSGDEIGLNVVVEFDLRLRQRP